MLRLRPFKNCDARTVASWLESEDAMYRWCADRYKTYPLRADDILAYYASMADSDVFFPMAAFDEQGLAGQLIIRFTDDEKTTVRFAHVIVDGGRRGIGLGSELINIALEYSFSFLKAEKVTLGVFENNPAAIKCYESAGFKDTGADTYYNIKGETWKCLELEMKKDSFA